jgi:signal peptidase I
MNLGPYWSAADPLDLAPAGIAAKGCKVKISSLKILRDIYYIAADDQGAQSDYPDLNSGFGIPQESLRALQRLYASPEDWEKEAALFTTRRSVEFKLDKDQYFPMGDNSSHSSDARIWRSNDGRDIEHYVHRDLLIGRAMFVYWPHTWNSPVPFTPNPGEMRRIR